MANIKVNTTELIRLLDIVPAEQNIMLVGKHGIGKSEILTNYYSQKGMPVVALFLGQMSDPGDLIGIPTKNEKTGKTDFMPPYWFPLDGKPIVLFLDELNRARPEILQTIMDLALNRKLAGKRLPDGSRIISAVNAGNQYQLTDLDPALVSRFNIVNFCPTVQEWLLWAQENDLDRRIIDFIQENPIWLDKEPDAKENADTGLDKTPDRRGWKRVSDVIKEVPDIGGVVTKVISSIVGVKAASEFLNNVSSKKIVSGKEVLSALEKMGEEQMNVAAAEAYVEELLRKAQRQSPPRPPIYVIKDVRLFLNSLRRGMDTIRRAGVNARYDKEENEEDIVITIHIPKGKPESKTPAGASAGALPRTPQAFEKA